MYGCVRPKDDALRHLWRTVLQDRRAAGVDADVSQGCSRPRSEHHGRGKPLRPREVDVILPVAELGLQKKGTSKKLKVVGSSEMGHGGGEYR
jgi:hypothetical protein